MACEGCESTPAAQEREKQLKFNEATTYGQKNKVDVFLYKDPVEGWKYCIESEAVGKPIATVIPHFAGVTPG